jgi:hypothetical protein
MSQENVEIVRKLNEAFNLHEKGWIEYYGTGAEFHAPPGCPRILCTRAMTRSCASMLS